MIRVSLQKNLLGSEGKIDLHCILQIPEKSILAIMGPSGAGKTSILKMLAGLMHPDEGEIEVGDTIWFSQKVKIWVPPQQRSVGFVFQDYALFPNMNVRQNLEYALQDQNQKAIVEEVLHLMNMEKLQSQKPGSLSGGQQQRVALARAIVRQPKVLLLDEPFAALDQQMRDKLQQDLLRLHKRYDTTTLLISHDVSEVARMADQVVYLEEGRIIEQGKPAHILPVISQGIITGEVIEVDEQSGIFVLYSKLSKGLWRFELPTGLHLHKGDTLQVEYQQGQILKQDRESPDQ